MSEAAQAIGSISAPAANAPEVSAPPNSVPNLRTHTPAEIAVARATHKSGVLSGIMNRFKSQPQEVAISQAQAAEATQQPKSEMHKWIENQRSVVDAQNTGDPKEIQDAWSREYAKYVANEAGNIASSAGVDAALNAVANPPTVETDSSKNSGTIGGPSAEMDSTAARMGLTYAPEGSAPWETQQAADPTASALTPAEPNPAVNRPAEVPLPVANVADSVEAPAPIAGGAPMPGDPKVKLTYADGTTSDSGAEPKISNTHSIKGPDGRFMSTEDAARAIGFRDQAVPDLDSSAETESPVAEQAPITPIPDTDTAAPPVPADASAGGLPVADVPTEGGSAVASEDSATGTENDSIDYQVQITQNADDLKALWGNLTPEQIQNDADLALIADDYGGDIDKFIQGVSQAHNSQGNTETYRDHDIAEKLSRMKSAASTEIGQDKADQIIIEARTKKAAESKTPQAEEATSSADQRLNILENKLNETLESNEQLRSVVESLQTEVKNLTQAFTEFRKYVDEPDPKKKEALWLQILVILATIGKEFVGGADVGGAVQSQGSQQRR